MLLKIGIVVVVVFVILAAAIFYLLKEVSDMELWDDYPPESNWHHRD